MSERILLYIQRNPHATLKAVSEDLNLDPRNGFDAVFSLARAGWLKCGFNDVLVPTFTVVETVGRCEGCGLVDHHRVAGLCTGCLTKFSGLDGLPRVSVQIEPQNSPKELHHEHTN